MIIMEAWKLECELDVIPLRLKQTRIRTHFTLLVTSHHIIIYLFTYYRLLLLVLNPV